MKLFRLHFVLQVVIVLSCNDSKPIGEENKAPGGDQSHLTSETSQENLNESYAINPVTGDPINPIVNSFGDTVKTGVPVPAKGRVIHPDSVARPKIISAGKPKTIPTYLNIHKVPENLTVIPINKDELRTFTPGTDTSSFVLVNSNGDTIPTGVPILIKGKIVKAIHTQPVLALPPQIKEKTQVSMKYLDVDQGLNNVSNVTSILEDKSGNIWIGTWGGGVSRYDGVTFTHFTQNEGLSNDYVLSILEDKNGNLWFGTEGGGINMYNGEFFTHYTIKEGLCNNIIQSMIQDKNENIWFGTRGGGVVMYHGLSTTTGHAIFTHFTQKEGLSNNDVRAILEDKNGNIWFGTRAGASMFNGEFFTHFGKKEGLSHNDVRAIFEDKNDNIWFGTMGGVSKLTIGPVEVNIDEPQPFGHMDFTHYTKKDGLVYHIVMSILEDKNGNIWFSTFGGGISRYDGASFTDITEAEGLSDNYVLTSYEDSSGNFWFGTDGGGVNIYKGESFSQFTENDGLSNNSVRSVIEDKSGNIWFASWVGGVSMYDGESFSQLTYKEKTFNQYVSMLEDKSGNIWFGHWHGGASMYDGEYITKFTENEGLSHNTIQTIFEDKSGNIWFGTPAGASMYNGEFFTHFGEKEGLSYSDVRAIFEDKNCNIWLCTFGGGVSKYNGKTFTHFTEKEGLSDNFIWTGMEDRQGNLWFGTWHGGVSIYDGKSFVRFTEKEGLSNNDVRSILEDKKGNIWLGTKNKLTYLVFVSERDKLQSSSNNNYEKATLRNNYKVYTYDKRDGLKGVNFYANSAYLDSKNRIWWGNRKGAEILDMNNFNLNNTFPNLQLNSIGINNEFIDFHNLNQNDSLGFSYTNPIPFYNYPKNLELDFSKNHPTFYFSAIDWSAPHKIKYSYKMEGLSNDWSIPSAEARADYRNLPYGTYSFKIKAIGGAQKWSEPFEYTFTILPPWWHTWWARLLYVITSIVLVIGIVHQRTSGLKKHQKELEQSVDDRTKELVSALEHLKEAQSQLVQSEKMASLGQLTAGIAHEINNPLGFIQTNSIALDQDLTDIKKLIQKYRSNNQKLNYDKTEIEDFEKSIDYETLISAINKEISNIKEGTRRTTEIVKNLREFSFKDNSKMEFADIHQGIVSTLNIMQSRFSNKVHLIQNFDSSIGEIKCNLSQLNQVFLNLLNNAFDAIEGNGEIEITTKNQKNSLLISIKDNGKGVPNEIIDKIFDPFFTTKKIGHGTGLGLYISHGIIESHGGKIEVKSLSAEQAGEVGMGSEFVVEIPKKK
jgi:signal transduction histidine kinase/ligand-binding sensor domain-containing protein